MPTKRPRLVITETPEVERRLDHAARCFPELAGERRRLLLRLTELGEQTLHAPGGDDRREAAKERILARTRALSTEDAEAILAARERDWRQDLE